ncbi:DNRLRE domain-containing protein [Streptomyces sp. NBC_00121]|uniref:LamG-like jellyroll fold domain-containing protein n=1 Tax=unclassified Streptomyces TaxID=2593676 RepID=UPI0028C4C368|nr:MULTISPECIES: LamG-like jellyroll fold domain-containing protein [unclassified Streptomyces]WNO63525.1 LamG-like jellyroll fold domain-containing protein [Streptomyces sp. AM2-3-1]WSC68104.1 DNRLRE domain-containing protein [Streptomyces sp. NBC_01760]
MQRSRGLSAALALSTAAGLGLVALPQPAAALTPPIAFTADDLPTWQTNGIVWTLAEAGGTVFAGGTFSQVRPPEGGSGTAQNAVNFVALNAATGNPTSCNLSFTIGSGSATVRALAVSPDKKTLYAGGYFGAVNGTPVSSLAAIDIATCTPKASFHPSVSATVRALAVTNDTVYLGGDFTSVGGSAHARYAAVDATSGAVKPFQADVDEPGRAVAVTPDGNNVILGGDFFTVNGANSHALAVVDSATGANVRTYPGFIENNSVVKALDTDATGFYTGNEGTGGGVFDGRIALDLSTLNQRWRDTCLGATQAVKSYQNVVYSASHAHDCSSVGEYPDGRRRHLLAEPTSGTNKLGWFPDTNDGLGEGIGPRAMAVSETSNNKYMWVGGEFTTVNGSAAQGLTHFAATPDVGAPTVPSVSAESVKPTEALVRWRASLDTDDTELTYKVYRNGGSTPVYTVDGDSVEWSRPQLSFTDTNVTAGSTYTYRVTATDGAGNASALSATASVTVPTSAQKYPAKVLDDGANLYWRYNESATPFVGDTSPGDQSGIHVNGPSLRQTPAAVTGPSTAIGFNGSDQIVYSDKRTTVPSQYSIETWFKTSTNSGGKLVGFGDNTTRASGNYDKHVYMRNDGRLVFGVWTGSARTITTPDSYNNGAWHHVVATQGSSGMALYVDGTQIGTLAESSSQAYSGYWHVGGDNLNGWPNQPSSNYFAGQIDETAIYPSVLSAAQVQSHYTLATAPADSVQTVRATDDTYANAGAPSTNYGTSTSLAVRGSAAYETYLRFDLPAAPAGTVLKSARLAVKTTTLSSAGSTDDFAVRPVTGSWTEAGTTYTSRPAVSSTSVGTLSGATELSTVYSATLDTSALSPALGGSYDLALTSTGTDALWVWSSEASAAENTPQLVLTFGAP